MNKVSRATSGLFVSSEDGNTDGQHDNSTDFKDTVTLNPFTLRSETMKPSELKLCANGVDVVATFLRALRTSWGRVYRESCFRTFCL